MVGLEIGRDIATVWLALFCFVGFAIPVVAAYFAVLGMNFVHRKSAELLTQTQRLSTRARAETEQASARVREPVIQLRKQEARVEGIIKALLRQRKQPGGPPAAK